MWRPGWWVSAVLLALGGCLYHAQEHTDAVVCDLVGRAYDLVPPTEATETKGHPDTGKEAVSRSESPRPRVWVSPEHGTTSSDKETDSQTTALMQAVPGESLTKARSRFSIPRVLPGAETGEIKLPSDPTARRRAIRELYPVLPPLPDEPPALPGPAGRPYTLADLQQIAAANSPSVR